MKTTFACAAVLWALVVAAPSWAQAPGPLNAITDVPGIEVGQYTESVATGGMTGTTVIVTRGGATGGVSQRGGAPGTRETDMLKPEKVVEGVRAPSRWAAAALAPSPRPTASCSARRAGHQDAHRPGQRIPSCQHSHPVRPGRCAPFTF
jgi:hypothetical protein